MGIVKQQTIKGSVYSYLGIFIGFISIYFIQPHALSAEQIGLTSILTNYSLMFAQFAMLGFNGTTRYFPYFRNEEKQHHGYLFLSCAVAFIGSALFIVLAIVFKNDIISQDAQKSRLFNNYYYYILPLTVFTLFFNVFNLYARMLYNVITGTLLNEFVKRLLILLPLVLIFFKAIDFRLFMVIWLSANVIPTILLAIKLMSQKQFFFKPDFNFLTPDLKSKLISISLFAILTGYAPLIVQNLDTYFVNKRFGLNSAGIYNLAFYFATIITVPTRALYNIAYTIVTDAWKHEDRAAIKDLYQKSCITQLISALFLFLLIWANVDYVFQLLPPAYNAGRYVIFFVGIGYVIDSATGINSILIGTSKYFKYESFFYVLLVGVTILSNIILIPEYGITGAAIAYTISITIFNLFRYLFILYVFKMQPFTIKIPLGIITGILVYYLSVWLIRGDNLGSTIFRGSFITAVYGAVVYLLNLSPDINQFLNKYLVWVGIKKHTSGRS